MKYFLIALFFCACCKSQVITKPLQYLVSEEFPGSTLNGWSTPGSQTITISGGLAHIVGSTVSDNSTLANINTSYGYSTMRNFTVETKFKFNNIAGYGVYCGVVSSQNPGQNMSAFAQINSSGTLKIIGADANGNLTTSASTNTSLDTSKWYALQMEVREGRIMARVKDVVSGSVTTVTYSVDFSTPYAASQMKPNIFRYSFGVSGATDAYFDYLRVSTTEWDHPQILFVGNSITTGLYCGSADSTYALMLRRYTSKTIQIAAGGYNTPSDVLNNMPELLRLAPETVILEIGTNSLGASTLSGIASIVSQLQSAGIAVFVLSIPTGGDPSTGGTYNASLSAAYGSNFINDYSTYGTGLTVDGVHPNLSGMRAKRDAIKSALPNLFNKTE